MTTIAVDKDYTLAADHRSTCSGYILCDSMNKIYKVEDDLIAGSGTVSEILEFIEWYKGDKERKPDLKNSNILILQRGKKLLMVQQTKSGSIHLVKNDVPAAIGSGGDLAIGAMLAGKSAEEAVKIAAMRDTMTNDKVKVWHCIN